MNYISLADSITVLYCAYMMLIGKVEALTQRPQNRLYNALGLDDGGIYNQMLPPYSAPLPVEVELWFRLQHIYSVQDALHTNVELIQKWYDENLKWNPEDYDNLTHLVVDEKSVWTPDIIVQNSVLDTSLKLNQFFGEESEKVKVEYTGIVTRRPSYLLSTVCQFDFKIFPYDVQQCPFIMRSVMYDVSILRLITQPFPASQRVFVPTEDINDTHFLTEDVATTTYHETNEWQLEFMISRHAFQEGADREYYDISLVEITFSRESAVHSGNIVNPFFYLLVVVLVSVFLPPFHEERISLLLAVMLAYTVLCLVVSDSLPKYSKETPELTGYLTDAMRYNVVLMTWYCVFFGVHEICSSPKCSKILQVCKNDLQNAWRQRQELKSQTKSGKALEQDQNSEKELERGHTQEKVLEQEHTPVQEFQQDKCSETDIEQGQRSIIDPEYDCTPVQELFQGHEPDNNLKPAQCTDHEINKAQQPVTALELGTDHENIPDEGQKAGQTLHNNEKELQQQHKQDKGRQEHDNDEILIVGWKVKLLIINYFVCFAFFFYNTVLLFTIWLELPEERQTLIDDLKKSYERSELIDFTETYG